MLYSAATVWGGKPDVLGKAERYFRALGRVPRFESKLKALEFKQGFATAVGDVEAWTAAIDAASVELRRSEAMGRLVALVLNLGKAVRVDIRLTSG